MAKHNYIKNQTDTTAEIYLYDEIGGFGINAAEFVNEFKYISDLVDTVKVRINSGGGSMVEGFGILTTLLNSKATVHTYVDGLAASMASIIMLAGEKRFIMDYATVMIHDPFNGGNSPKDQEIIQRFKDSALTVYTQKTGKDKDTLSAMMAKETWLSASQALEEGFVTEVITTNQPIEAKRNEIISVYNSLKKSNKMENIAKLLKVDNATEETVLASVQSTLNKVNELENKNEALTVENKQALELVESLQNKVNEIEENKAKELVNAAFEAGKISEESKTSWEAFAKKDYEAAKTSLDGIQNTVKPSLTKILNTTTKTGKTLADLRAELKK